MPSCMPLCRFLLPACNPSPRKTHCLMFASSCHACYLAQQASINWTYLHWVARLQCHMAAVSVTDEAEPNGMMHYMNS
jgi:hypothetical protein